MIPPVHGRRHNRTRPDRRHEGAKRFCLAHLGSPHVVIAVELLPCPRLRRSFPPSAEAPAEVMDVIGLTVDRSRARHDADMPPSADAGFCLGQTPLIAASRVAIQHDSTPVTPRGRHYWLSARNLGYKGEGRRVEFVRTL
jgi:hypothetical protein